MSEETPNHLTSRNKALEDKERSCQVQLVDRRKYLKVMSEKGIAYSVVAFCGVVGTLLILLAVAMLLFAISWENQGGLEEWDHLKAGDVMIILFIGILGVGAIWIGKTVFSIAQRKDPVKLITPQNAHLLPARETLVRAADLSTSDAKIVLLRAAGQGPETPSAVLLRAGSEQETPS